MPREPIFKIFVSYTRPVPEAFGARLHQVPQGLNEVNFVDIDDMLCPLQKKPRVICFVKYPIPKDQVSRMNILLEIKRQRLRPATFHEFAAFLQHYPKLAALRSLVCLGSHGRSHDRVVLLSLEHEHGNQNLYFADVDRKWSRGANILCIMEQH